MWKTNGEIKIKSIFLHFKWRYRKILKTRRALHKYIKAPFSIPKKKVYKYFVKEKGNLRYQSWILTLSRLFIYVYIWRFSISDGF